MKVSATVLTTEPQRSVATHTVVVGQAPPRPSVAFEGPMLIEPTREVPTMTATVAESTGARTPGDRGSSAVGWDAGLFVGGGGCWLENYPRESAGLMRIRSAVRLAKLTAIGWNRRVLLTPPFQEGSNRKWHKINQSREPYLCWPASMNRSASSRWSLPL